MSTISKRAWALGAGLVLGSGVCGTQTAQAQTQAQTKAITQGMAERMSNLHHRQLDMLRRKPDGILKMPPVNTPVYGIIALGPEEKPTPFYVALDPTAPDEPRVWIDANGNGDLTDDPPIVWTKIAYTDSDNTPLALYQGSVTLQVHYKNGVAPLRLSLLRYDPNDPNREGFHNAILYKADYARETDIKLGANTYHAMLYDAFTRGDYRGGHDPQGSGVGLYIDVNGNGQYDEQGEQFDALRPFNIKGVTYELANMAPDGSAFSIVRSRQNVPEILPPPDLRVGKSVLPFEKKRLDGTVAHFPADYKGRLVMLYFWASYCPECQAEIPFVRDSYRQFHDQGVDILGVSVDYSPELLKIPIARYVQESHMPWPQIYEGKSFQGDLARLYNVTLTPTPFLVDGDTGKILAVGGDLRGARLAETLQKALAAKK